jgi:hypothetical protein
MRGLFVLVGVAVGLGMEGKLVLLGCRDVVWIVNVVELDIAAEDGEGGLNGRIAAIVSFSLSLLLVSSVGIKKSAGVSSSSTELESNSPFIVTKDTTNQTLIPKYLK